MHTFLTTEDAALAGTAKNARHRRWSMPHGPAQEGHRRDPSTCTRFPDRRPGALAGASRARQSRRGSACRRSAARPAAPTPTRARASSKRRRGRGLPASPCCGRRPSSARTPPRPPERRAGARPRPAVARRRRRIRPRARRRARGAGPCPGAVRAGDQSHRREPAPHRRAGAARPPAGDQRISADGAGWFRAELRHRPGGAGAARRKLRRQDRQGCAAGRSADRVAVEVRAGHQSRRRARDRPDAARGAPTA